MSFFEGDKTDCNKYRWGIIAINLIQKFVPYFSLKVKSIDTWNKSLGIISVGLDITDQLLIRFCTRQIQDKNRSTMREYISYS
jgi:hypothetical protein